MKKTVYNPPRWARSILSWYCKPSLLEDLEGDLYEYFQRNVQRKGIAYARLIYVLDVIKFIRPYTIRKPEFLNLLIHWLMLSSYIKTSGRSIYRNKLFSSINIIGLAISMTTGLIMISMLTDLYRYDKFHEHYDDIYRVIARYEYNGKSDFGRTATTSLKAARAIEESFTGVEKVAILQRDFSGDIHWGEQTVPLRGLYGNQGMLDVFSFPLIRGNRATALKEPFTVVLTESAATRLFGDEEPLGKVVKMGSDSAAREYVVTGVLQDIPRFSHMHFDMLASLATKDITDAGNERAMAWDNMWGTWVYLLIPDKNNLDAIGESFTRLSAVEDKTVERTHIELDLQPIREIVVGEDLGNQIGTTMGNAVIKILGTLAFIVIFSACLNYTNLSIARALRRTREVGIRKTIGALRSHVASQFIVESVIISLMALVIATLLFFFIRPHFLSMEESLNRLLSMEFTPELTIYFIGFAVVVGVAAGLFPAIFFSRINAVQVLKNMSAIPALKGMTLRKALIVFQYSISIIAITATIIINKQYNHFIAFDLGFTTENILNIRLHGTNADHFENELRSLPEVQGVSRSAMVTSVGNYWMTFVKTPNDPTDSVAVHYNTIDHQYLPLHDHTIIAGRNFGERQPNSPESEVIVNEKMVERFNLGNRDPQKAIGERLIMDGKEVTVVGVMRDFHYGRADGRPSNEVMMRNSPDGAEYMNVRIQSNNLPETYARIESIWKKVDNVHGFEATFYDDEIEQAFQGLKASMRAGFFLTLIVICIASIGLLGMVVFTTETRIREVSIRKVFGASERGLLLLLSKGFVVLLMIAAVISLPIAYIVADTLLLPELVNHAPLGIAEFLIGIVGILCVALLMIGTQTLKVARANPAEVLKSE